MDGPDVPVLLSRLALAVLLGGAIGLERELRSKPAGLRTHMMVSLGAALFTLTALELHRGLGGPDAEGADAVRAVQGVANGIGFLGAGSIIRSGGSVEGLTTASAIWCCGALGVACGAGLLTLASLAAGVALLVLVVVGAVEVRFLHPRAPTDPESP